MFPLWTRAAGCLLAGITWLLASCAAPAAPSASPVATERSPASAPAAAPAATPPPAPLPLKFAYTALSTTITPYWIALDAGLFQEEGLAVEPTFISASTVGMQALIAREIDVTTVTGGAALQAAVNGAPVVLFATNVNAVIAQLIVSSEITRPEQLRGQPLGVVRFGTVSDFVARLLLRGWGLEPGRDVPLIQTGGQAETIGAMQSGGVRAVVVADLAALELRRLGYALLADGADLGREYVGLGVVALRPYLDSHPEAIRRFTRALARGLGRFVKDKEYSIEVLRRYTRLEDVGVLEGSWELHTTRYANRSLRTTPEALRTVQEEIQDDPRVQAFDVAQLIDNRFVEELHRSGLLEQVYR